MKKIKIQKDFLLLLNSHVPTDDYLTDLLLGDSTLLMCCSEPTTSIQNSSYSTEFVMIYICVYYCVYPKRSWLILTLQGNIKQYSYYSLKIDRLLDVNVWTESLV